MTETDIGDVVVHAEVHSGVEVLLASRKPSFANERAPAENADDGGTRLVKLWDSTNDFIEYLAGKRH